MNCKACGETISKDAYKKVADWIFCPKCFEDLMNPPLSPPLSPTEQESEPVENVSKGRSAKAVSRAADQSNICGICSICNTPIINRDEKKLGIWNLCESCHTEMTFQAPKEVASKPCEDIEDEGTQASPESGDKMKRMSNRTIPCSGCNRDILEVAAKKEGDDFFCPDCFYTRDNK